MSADQVCEYRERDEKRRPFSHEYVLGLENRIAWLEALVMQIKDSPPEERETILESVSFHDHLPSLPNRPAPSSTAAQDISSSHPQADLRLGPEGSLIYHGPTSIYRVQSNGLNITEQDNPGSPSLAYLGSDLNFDHVLSHFDIDIEDGLITDVLMLFFKWQYPHFMFIYREAFLRDHFSDRLNPTYWSSALLLAICALGTLMRPGAERREISERFFAAAERIILVSGLTHPSITTVQTFLCLAFYEIGRGNLSKGWGYSGMFLPSRQIPIPLNLCSKASLSAWPKIWASNEIRSTGYHTT